MDAHVIDATARSRRRVGVPGRALRLWPWLPLPLGVVYLVTILVKFNQIVASTYLNADAASAPVIGELFGGSPAHRQVFLGQMGWFSTLIFELATRHLPLHRQLWEAAPYAMALASVALIAWAAWRVAGRWAAAITGVLLLCAGPHALGLLFSLNDHSTTWFSLALLAALLVFFEAPPAWLKAWSGTLIALLTGIVLGANAASDLVLLAAGFAPVLLAAGLAWALRPGRASARAFWSILGVVLVAAVCDAITHAVMKHENVLTPGGLVHDQLAAAEALGGNFKLWWQSLMVLGNGDFFGKQIGFTSALQLLCALLTVAALVLVVRFAWRAVSSTRRTPRDRGRDVQHEDVQHEGAQHEGSQREDAHPLRIAWLSFWGASALLLSLSFVFSSNPIDIGSSRYLLGAIYSAAALAPLLATRRPALRVVVTAGAVLFAFTGLVSLFNDEELAGANQSYSLYNQVERLAKREGLAVGYADYWDAAPIMWSTHFRVRAYPVQDCAPNLCWTPLHMISSWYTTPRPGVRSFLIADAAEPTPAAPTPNLGKPVAVHRIGAMTMYVYPYDIGSRTIP